MVNMYAGQVVFKTSSPNHNLIDVHVAGNEYVLA